MDWLQKVWLPFHRSGEAGPAKASFRDRRLLATILNDCRSPQLNLWFGRAPPTVPTAAQKNLTSQ
jgi:hypothetical protein